MKKKLGAVFIIRNAMLVVTAISIGLPIGIGFYVFWYGQGTSYLKDEPKACMNCHVMQPQFTSWARSSHRAVATCNSCHAPGNLIQKLKTKAINGFLHSYAFTTGNFQDPIRIKPRNRISVEKTCLNCHADIFAQGSTTGHSPQSSCLRCHADVGHASGAVE